MRVADWSVKSITAEQLSRVLSWAKCSSSVYELLTGSIRQRGTRRVPGVRFEGFTPLPFDERFG
jgi:hypothetical protein